MSWQALRSLDSPQAAAELYLRLGLSPIALWAPLHGGCSCPRGADCEAPGKHPSHPAWQRERPVPGTLLRELGAWPRNVGLRTGTQPSGRALLVVDVDGGRGPLAALGERLGAPLPRTLCARTARGWHLVYAAPPDQRNAVRLGGIAGVDVRAEGGQIVAPPSVHVTGARYRWTLAMRPVAAPAALLALLAPPPRVAPVRHERRGDGAGERALAKVCDSVARAGAGTRHDAAFRGAVWLGARIAEGLDLDEARAARALVDAAMTAGLSQHEAERCARDGIGLGRRSA